MVVVADRVYKRNVSKNFTSQIAKGLLVFDVLIF